jgi:kynurenine formamidase
VDQIPTERLIAPLIVLDVSAKVTDDPDYQISVEDIARWEKAHGQIPLSSVVMARMGWDSRWNSLKDYRNADSESTMHFPGYSLDAAKFLVDGRNVLGLGIDTLSVDHGLSKIFPCASTYWRITSINSKTLPTWIMLRRQADSSWSPQQNRKAGRAVRRGSWHSRANNLQAPVP